MGTGRRHNSVLQNGRHDQHMARPRPVLQGGAAQQPRAPAAAAERLHTPPRGARPSGK